MLGVAVAQAARHDPRGEVGRGLVEQGGQRAVHERDVDVLPAPVRSRACSAARMPVAA